MRKIKGKSLYDALQYLNNLIWKKGFEFPDAIAKTLEHYEVDSDELRNAYDNQ